MNVLRHRVVDILTQLVSFESVSGSTNLPLLAWIESYLSDFGIAAELFDHVPGSRANLFATLGPTDIPGLVLSGHTDVVPVENQNWHSDPFNLMEKDNCLFGRGTADMKGFIAICLALVPEMVRAKLTRPIHLAFSCDEEIGCKGVVPLIDGLSKRQPLPFGAIVGEPTNLQVVTGQKGTVTYETTVTGVATHSCDPQLGLNAITTAAKLIAKIEELSRTLVEQGDPGSGFRPPWTTINVGVISGGVQKNIVPSNCVFRWECRPLPDRESADSVEDYFQFEKQMHARLRAVHPEAGVETRLINRVVGLRATPGSEVETLAKRAAGRNDAGCVSFASEAGLFQQTGVPTVLCGPGSIEQAHKADEFITLEQVDRGIDFVASIVEELSA